MSMDALTTAALDTLCKKALPELLQKLTALLKNSPAQRDFSTQTKAQIQECIDLLTMLKESHNPALVQTEIPQTAKLADIEELSDDEAAMLLAEMDAPIASKESSTSEELSDDEAAMLLAEMDAPVASKESSTSEELSDDEAAMLLAEMDAPLASTASQNPNEMSDDEASRLLAEMDETPPPAAPSIAKPTAPKKATVTELSAEDEAEALLRSLGGDDSPMTSTGAKTPAPQPAASSAVDSHLESQDAEEIVGEIPEWEPNDFQTDPDMVSDFINNSDEILQSMDECILRLEQDPTNKEIIEEIFRGAHTLKGAAGMFGFKGIERVMHRMENLFDLIRKGKLVPSSDTVDVVFQGMDALRILLAAVKDGKPCGAPTANVVNALSAAASGRALPSAARTPVAPKASVAETAPPTPKNKDEVKPTEGASKKDASANTIRVDLDRLDLLVNLIGELVIDRTRFVHIEEELRSNHPQVKLTANISETVQLFGRHMNEIQDIIMKVRMVPIGNAFNKFTRIVRELSKSLNKQIDLYISGESAELDKTLVEQIGDPLVHLIRNSCDHGVESPEERKKKGKDPRGRILLSAMQEGNNIVIKIEDDGKGIDPNIIRRKAIEKGIISEDEQLSERDIFNLIFAPGFSTAEQVTNISGRGVGMDVVKKNIMKLKGMIEIESTVGKGTCISIRLPLTLAIVQSLLVKSNHETFAIPLSSVIESIRVTPQDIQKIGDAEVVRLRDKVLPLLYLNDALKLDAKSGTIPDFITKKRLTRDGRFQNRTKSKLFVVVVGHPERPFGIVVDQLLNQQEMVIKSMGRILKKVPCVAGGAVLGHGEVVLVLDMAELEESFRAKARNHVA